MKTATKPKVSTPRNPAVNAWEKFLHEVEGNLEQQITYAKNGNFEQTEKLSLTLKNLLPAGWDISDPLSDEYSRRLQNVLTLYRELRLVLMTKVAEFDSEMGKIKEDKRKLARYKRGVFGQPAGAGVLLAS